MGNQEHAFGEAKNKALSLLSRRRHTKKELADKLLRAGFGEADVQAVCGWAAEYGFLNDEEFARSFVADSVAFKKYGKKRIRQALLFKGVDSCIIDDVFAEFDFHEAETLAKQLPKKLAGNFDRKNVDKAIRHFAAKGYAYDEIKSALEQVKEEYFLGEDDGVEL